MVRLERAAIAGEETPRTVDITVTPVAEPLGGPALVGVIFEEAAETGAVRGAVVESEGEAGSLVDQLESELNAARQELQLTAAEHEAANEELRAAHEEAISMNEELRATNEELETSKEEVQSVNEELNTLNRELHARVDQLNRTSADLANLLSATEIATIFLDREGRIRSFTPSATELLNLRPVDVGRPLRDISSRFPGRDLADLAAQVLQTLAPLQYEVETREGRWYLMRVLPYRSVDGQVEGVVLTFADVTALKRAEQESQRARVYAECIVATAREPLLVLDDGLRVVSANPAFYRAFGLALGEVEGVRLPELGGGRWRLPALVEQLSTGEAFEDFEVEIELPEAGRRAMVLSGARIEAQTEGPRLVLLAMEDITEERRRRQLAETLTSEVSHRTKNNLAIVAGLLELQADREPRGSASARALRDAVTRVNSFVALHEQRAGSHPRTRSRWWRRWRGSPAAHAARLTGDEAEISVEGAPLRCPFQVAANLGLLANELITNTLKYGGPDATGVLRIRVTVGTDDGGLQLSIWNSGNPIADDFDVAATKTTGLYLVTGLAIGHYRGGFVLQPYQQGTLAEVTIPARELQQAK